MSHTDTTAAGPGILRLAAARPTRRQLLGGIGAAASLAALPRASRAVGEPIRIGVSAPLTAQFAQLGQWTKNGINIATAEINGRGGIKGRPLEVIFADDQGPNPTAAANAVTKLLAQEKVTAMIGPHFTPAILPNLPLLEHFKTPTLTGASGPAVTERKSPWVFRTRLNDNLGAALLVKFATEELGWKKIGLEYVNTAFGQSGIAAVKQALTEAKVEPALVQTHTDATRDFTPHVLAFNDAGVDGVISWTDDQPAGLFVKQMRTLGAKFGLAGSTSFSQPMFLQLAGDGAEGIYSVSDFTTSNPSPAIQDWNKRYESIHHEQPELYATTYYDTLNLLARALDRAPELTGPALRQALTELHGVAGVMTTYDYSPTGDMVHAGLITRVEGGQPKVVRTIGA